MAMASGTAAARTVATDWNDEALQAIRTTHPGPPMVARMLAMTDTAMYDAWAAYDARANGTELAGELRRPASERTDANRSKAVSYAAYRVLLDLFPSEAASFRARMTALGYDPDDNSQNLNTAVGIGNVAAAALLQSRHHDGSNQLGDMHAGAYSDYTQYVPVNFFDQIVDPNHWQPLRVSDGHGGFVTQTCIAPFWGRVKPFALHGYNQFPVTNPARYGTPEYRKQVLEIVHYSATLDDRKKVIAEYWADGPRSELPPGHWVLFAKYVSERDHHTLSQDVTMNFAMTSAVLDASVAVWGYKRQFDYIRPVSAVHYLFKDRPILAWGGPGKGARVMNGRDWQPYQASTVVTPPFSEYVSGHSAFSAAAAEVLKLYTGSDRFGASVTSPAGSSRVEPGLVPAHDVTLSWPTFSAAADEAGISRRYGGIHFVQGDMQSRALGRKVGAQAFALASDYISGRAGN
ncbi:vanadium-dependent haloperoxidase [Lysobacter xanthus]